MKNSGLIVCAMVLFMLSIACQGGNKAEAGETNVPGANKEVAAMPEIKVTSPAFVHEGMIPARYTCDGDDLAPEIMWKNLPAQAVSLVLICDDPDAPAGSWIHWIVYNIPVTDTCISQRTLEGHKKCLLGQNSWGKNSYGGPCPPGGTHRYYFKLYALDCELSLKAGAGKGELLKAMEGHILAQGELMGRYQRQS